MICRQNKLSLNKMAALAADFVQGFFCFDTPPFCSDKFYFASSSLGIRIFHKNPKIMLFYFGITSDFF